MAIGATGLAFAVHRLKRELGDRTTVLMGTMAAFVFAAQMVNFPVGPAVSGYLLGGVLAAVLLVPGPAPGDRRRSLGPVLDVRRRRRDRSPGANFLNMGLLGAGRRLR